MDCRRVDDDAPLVTWSRSAASGSREGRQGIFRPIALKIAGSNRRATLVFRRGVS
jgi:hypothetical protein